MAGKSHNHTMNIGIRVNAGGIGKTNSELKNLSNEVNSLNGKHISLKVDLGDKASKSIDSIVNSIGSIEKSLNSLSTTGIDSISQGFSTLNKSAMDVVSAIGSVQKAIDGMNAKAPTDVASSMGNVTKSATDASSAVGGVSQAVDSINIGNIDELASALGKVISTAQEAASAVGKVGSSASTTSLPNWSNSYGGRYGGMRYTGQEMGLSDLISGMSNGKSNYDLTVNNAMNKERNKAVVGAWRSETGDPNAGMTAYNAMDDATNNSLISLNTLAAGANAFAATANASAEQMASFAPELATFGGYVMGLGYTEDVAQTAVMKLARGLHGNFAALDQYGITKESLTNVRDEKTGKQLWNGDENDLEGYMKAVNAIAAPAMENLMGTQSGQQAYMSKQMSLGGYALGEIEAGLLKPIMMGYAGIDKWLLDKTKSMELGASIKNNQGQQAWKRKKEDGTTEWAYGDDRPGEDWTKATTGFNLSTLIVGADQVIGTYKVVKDTILSTIAEIKDFQRLRKVGLKGIFGADNYDIVGGHITGKAEEAKDALCEATNGDCPQQRANEKKKKKGIFGRTKDKISNAKNKIKELPSDIATGTKNSINSTKDKIGKTKEKIKNRTKNPHSIISNSNFKGYDKPIEIPQKPKKNKIKPKSVGDDRAEILAARKKMAEETERRNQRRKNVSSMHGKQESIRQTQNKKIERSERARVKRHPYDSMQEKQRKKVEADQKSLAKKRLDSIQQKQREKVGRDAAALNEKRLREQGIGSRLKQGKSNLRKNIGNKLSNAKNRLSETKGNISNATSKDNIKNKVSSSKNNIRDYFGENNKKREAAGNKYNGYMKRTNKALYDVGNLKNKAKKYIKNKKDLLQKEFASGQLSGAVNKRMWGDKGAKLPGKIWGASKISAGFMKQDLANSTQWQSLKNQGSFLKNGITNSGAYQTMSSFAGKAKGQVAGNAKAVGKMTGFTPWFMGTRAGQKVNQWKQQGAKTTAGNAVSKAGGVVSKAGGAAVKGISSGVGAVAGTVGKIGGLMSGIMGGVMGLLGPIGAIMMAVTLITGLLDAMGVDWMGPLQTAFGGFIEALQPAIQGFGTWLQDTAVALEPVLTQIGQVLGPILQALGGLISGGLGAIAQALGPVLEGLGNLFGGGDGGGFLSAFTNGLNQAGGILEKLGPMAKDLWSALGQGAEGMGGFLGGIFDGIGQYITHIIQEAANTISMWFTTIATGIGQGIQIIGQFISMTLMTIITTIGTAIGTAFVIMGTMIGTMFTMIGVGIGAGIAAIGIGTGAAIMATLGALGAGIAMIGVGIGAAIMAIGVSAAAVVTAIGASIGFAIAAVGGAIAAVIAAISAAVTMGITAMATAITMGITMISTGILMAFTGFATTVAASTAAAYATLLAFQGTAVGLMGTIATDMVNNFKSNFTGVDAAVGAEMSGAYNTLCQWGDKMVAKAEEIGRRMKQALVNIGMGINSPGYIWNAVKAEFAGTWGEMQHYGRHMQNTAKYIGTGIVANYARTFSNKNLDFSDVPVSKPIPPTTDGYETPTPVPVQETPVLPPKVEAPSVTKELKHKPEEEQPPTQIIFNHYGDLDNEDRANKVLKFISDKMGFENKRAGRTVNKTKLSAQ